MEIKNVLVGERNLGEISTGRVHDALRLRGRARGVEQVQQLLGIHWFGGTIERCFCHDVVVPNIATFDHLNNGVATIHNDYIFDRWRTVEECFVDLLLQRSWSSAAVASICGDDQLAVSVFAAIPDRVWAEASEDDRVNNTNTAAREHCNGQLEDHRHVNCSAITFLQPERLQRVRELLYFVEQL